MGAAQSSTSSEKIIYNETPISFSPELLNHLEDSDASPETTPAQQSVLDAHVRARIQAEIARLRVEEEDVKKQMELALEKENIERERGSWAVRGEEEEEGGVGQIKSSVSLQADLEEVRKKVERFHKRRSLDDLPEVLEAKEKVVECYQRNSSRPLDCWREVEDFKLSVKKAEKEFIETLR